MPKRKPIPTDLKSFQDKASDLLVSRFEEGNSNLLLAAPGTGKTHTICGTVHKLQAKNILTDSSHPVIIVGPKSTSIHWNRMVTDFGLKNCMVTWPGELRNTVGEVMLRWDTININGESSLRPTWLEPYPSLIITDECQDYKNPLTAQARIIKAAGDQGIPVIAASATPFVRIIDAEVICKVLGVASDLTWPEFSWAMCARGRKQEDRSPHSALNLRDHLLFEHKIVKHIGVKYPKKVLTECSTFRFTPVKQAMYDSYYENYLAVQAKAGEYSDFQIMVALLKFFQGAEELRVYDLALRAVAKLGRKQTIVAVNFKTSLDMLVAELTGKFGLRREELSVITGGQNIQERQQEIDRFQAGRTKICVVTVATGGVGLNLQHDNPAALPRHLITGNCWSPYKFLQLLYRVQRMNNLSDSTIEVVLAEGTIEESNVKPRLLEGVRCLSKFITKADGLIDCYGVTDEPNDEAELLLGEEELNVLAA